MGDKNHSNVNGFFFQKWKNMVFRNFLDEKVFLLQVAIVLTRFPKNHKINVIECTTFCWNTLQYLLRFVFEKAKHKSCISVILHSHFCLILYRNTILYLVQTFRTKSFTKSIKIAPKTCNHERIISKSDDYVLHYKIIPILKL